MTWEETLARLEEAVRGGGDGAMVRKADIRAALERDEQGHAACVRHGCGCNDAGATRVECPEHAALRQRVEELERAPRCCADTIPPGCRTCRCADAAEAKLAKVVTLLTNVEWSDNPWNAIKAARAAAQPKEETR